jgi:outer membrane protein OmpA-like peptidoglycan-associated protein
LKKEIPLTYLKQCLSMIAASAVLGGAALAQTKPLPQFDLERFPINVSGNADLAMQGGTINPEGTLRFTAFGEIADAVNVNRDVDGFNSYSLTRKLLWLEGTYAANQWLQVSLQVPFVVFQNGLTSLQADGFRGPDLNGVGTPYLGGRVSILRQDSQMPLNLAVDLRVGLPLGSSNAFNRDLRAPILPTLSASHDFGDWRLNGQIQGTFRSQSTMELVSTNKEDTFDHELGAGIGVSGTPIHGVPLRLEGDALLNVALKNSATSVQTFAGARYQLLKGTDVFLGGGPAFGSLIGTPEFMVMGGVTFTGGGSSSSHAVEGPVGPVAAQPVCVAGQPHRTADCPALDDDNDGVPNGMDNCPTQAEDKDGFQDQDGCPDPDNDGDGLVDALDQCPTEVGPSTNHGCPVKDADHDGIADADDLCPTVAGDLAHKGCVAPADADNDGVADAEDNCVTVAGSKENHGCPAKQKQLVVIQKDNLQILDKVYFSSGGSRIQRRSRRLLNQIAEIVKSHPDMPRLEIQGHTDNRGSPSRNLVLSQKRAQAVRDYLERRGVPASRLEAKGYGPSRPIETNMTAAGREANRRVEFRVATPTPASPAAGGNAAVLPTHR